MLEQRYHSSQKHTVTQVITLCGQAQEQALAQAQAQAQAPTQTQTQTQAQAQALQIIQA